MSSILIALTFSFSSHAQKYVPGEVIVKLRGEADSTSSYAFMGKAHSQKAMQLEESWDQMNMYHFKLGKGQDVEATLTEIRKDPNVLYPEPNYYIEKSAHDVGIQQTFTADSIQAQAVSAQGTYMATSAPIGAQAAGESFWLGRPFTRVVAGWKKAYRIAKDYVVLNVMEAEGFIDRREIRSLKDLFA